MLLINNNNLINLINFLDFFFIIKLVVDHVIWADDRW